jgi:thioredoxin 1
MATKLLTKDNFHASVKDGIALVDFWAPWCGPCRTFAPVFEQVSNVLPDVTFGKVNTQDEPALADDFRIRAIPTLMAFREGILLFQHPGALPPHALERLVQEIRNLDMNTVRAKTTTSGTP